MERPTLATAVLRGGLLGGALDLLFALSFAAGKGVAPARLLQTIASGWLGEAAYSGGTQAAALGMLCHFALAIAWAAVFAWAAVRTPVLPRRPLLAAAGFGCLVLLAMRLVVLPVSAYPKAVSFEPVSTGLDLLSHMFLFALPIVVCVGQGLGRRDADRAPGAPGARIG